jgi:hypothetical protein
VTNDPPKKKLKNSATEPHPNLEEEIRCRAYELYEARGCEDGHDLEDWFQAEAEIVGTTEELVAAA